MTLSEAVAIYMRLKGKNPPVTFHRAAEPAGGYVVGACGNKNITAYRRADANALRDALVAKKLAGSSITRIIGTVRSVINFAASGIGVSLQNPFAGVYYDRKRASQIANRFRSTRSAASRRSSGRSMTKLAG